MFTWRGIPIVTDTHIIIINTAFNRKNPILFLYNTRKIQDGLDGNNRCNRSECGTTYIINNL